MQHWCYFCTAFPAIRFIWSVGLAGIITHSRAVYPPQCADTSGEKEGEEKRSTSGDHHLKTRDSPRLIPPQKTRGTMSSTRFKKDKEIIADYETQVKGAACVFVRSVCIVSAEADSDWPGASVLYQPACCCCCFLFSSLWCVYFDAIRLL